MGIPRALHSPLASGTILQYDASMESQFSTPPSLILGRLLEPVGRCLTPAGVRELVDLGDFRERYYYARVSMRR